MKRWLKIFLIVFAVLVIGGAGAFLYVDYKITQTMVNMVKKQDQMKAKKDTLTVDNEDIPAGSSNKVKSQGEESSLNDVSETVHSEIDDPESQNPGSKPDVKSSDERPSSKDSKDESKQGSKASATQTQESETSAGESVEEQSHDNESDNETLQNEVETDSHSQETQSEGIQTEATQAASTDEDVPNVDKDSDNEDTEVVEEAPDMDEVTDATTIRERAKAYELAFSKLSQSQVDRLFEMAADGFTQAEKDEAKAMFYANFTPEEQAWILEMYRKHY